MYRLPDDFLVPGAQPLEPAPKSFERGNVLALKLNGKPLTLLVHSIDLLRNYGLDKPAHATFRIMSVRPVTETQVQQALLDHGYGEWEVSIYVP